MSTHPRTEHDDLDRTDELPRLDIAAYEAKLADESNDTLASTDTWAVEGLRDAEAEEADDTAALRFSRTRAPSMPTPQTDVALEATRILGRIEQLEAELDAARTHGHDEQQAATTARLALEQQLAELSAIATQLRDSNAQLDEEAQAATKLAQTQGEVIEQFRQRLASEEKNSAQLALHLATKISEHASAHQEVSRRDVTIAALTETRDDLARLLETSQNDAASATTQLADLTTKYKAIDLTLRERDDAITALDSRIATLENDLRIAHDAIASLTNERDQLQGTLAAERASQSQAQQALSARAQEIDHLHGSTEALHARIATLQEQLASEQNSHSANNAQIQNLERALNENQMRRDLLTGEVESLRARLQQLETREQERESEALQHAANLADARRQAHQQHIAVQSLEQVIRARDTLADRLRAELQTSQDERAIMAGQLEKSRARNKSLGKDIFGRDNQIAALKADLAVHVEALAAIRQDVNRASARTEQPDRILEPVDHDGDIIELNKKVMTIGRTSENDICIPSKLVSRTHARLLIGPNAVIVEDAGSTNGCLVNEVEVKQHAMRDGDVLSIGDLKYRLRTRSGSDAHDRDNVVPFQ